MITLKTKRPYLVQVYRGFRQLPVHISVKSLQFTNTGVSFTGIYYVILEDLNGEKYVLDSFHDDISWGHIEPLERGLSALDTVSLRKNILSRLRDFTLLTLKFEGEKNFGISPDDWTDAEQSENNNSVE